MDNTTYKINLNKKLCEYITKRFLSDFDKSKNKNSQNKYAKAVGLTSSTIGKIAKEEGYNIPVATIALILRYEKVEMEKFFADFNQYWEK